MYNYNIDIAKDRNFPVYDSMVQKFYILATYIAMTTTPGVVKWLLEIIVIS